MSSIIDFLERMGADAQWRHATPDDIALALAKTQIDAAVGAAIIARSTSELYALLDQRPMFHTQNNPGKEGEDVPEKEGDEEQDAPESSPENNVSATLSTAARTNVALA
ncbi:hypothetical protein [Dyella sp. 20L07]|uniref:hypothetical protein n=1 Tax=Dyella sp. 20L07 TaxID=3384240 RepID=UPI003D27604B